VKINVGQFDTAMNMLYAAGLDAGKILRDGTSPRGYETSENNGDTLRFDSNGNVVREFHPWPPGFDYAAFRAELDRVVEA
jgi:hypothetical protein